MKNTLNRFFKDLGKNNEMEVKNHQSNKGFLNKKNGCVQPGQR